MADRFELLKDLCSRLPYGVKVHYKGEFGEEPNPMPINSYDGRMVNCHYEIEGIKPYLRPMSSMTKKESKEYYDLCHSEEDVYIHVYYYDTVESIDWLNAHHFDYRGLIEKGLALEAPEGMYKID